MILNDRTAVELVSNFEDSYFKYSFNNSYYFLFLLMLFFRRYSQLKKKIKFLYL